MQIIQNRRDFLVSTSLAAAAGVLGARRSLADEGPPETTTIRLAFTTGHLLCPCWTGRGAAARRRASRTSNTCKPPEASASPQMIAKRRRRLRRQLRRHGRLPSGCRPAAHRARRPACRLLRAVRARADPQHQRPEGPARRHPERSNSSGHLYLSIMATLRRPRRPAGLRVDRAVPMAMRWSSSPTARPMPSSAFRPEPQELRARGIDRVILSTVSDRPWSQYLLLHDLRQPRLGARAPCRDQALSARGLQGRRVLRRPTPSMPRVVWSMAGSRRSTTTPSRRSSELPYELWHEYDSEDSMRFCGLRLHEAGMLRIHAPNALLAEGTDWSFRQRAEARAEGVRQGPPGGSVCPAASTNRKRRLLMQIIQNRRDFLVSTVAGRGRGRAWRPGHRSPTRAPPETSLRSGSPELPEQLPWRPCWWPRTCCARKGSPTSAT